VANYFRGEVDVAAFLMSRVPRPRFLRAEGLLRSFRMHGAGAAPFGFKGADFDSDCSLAGISVAASSSRHLAVVAPAPLPALALLPPGTPPRFLKVGTLPLPVPIVIPSGAGRSLLTVRSCLPRSLPRGERSAGAVEEPQPHRAFFAR
jgi:hypothetical protein